MKEQSERLDEEKVMGKVECNEDKEGEDDELMYVKKRKLGKEVAW